MAVRQSTNLGDKVARKVKASIATLVKESAGVELSSTLTIDQMVRVAAKNGVYFQVVVSPGSHEAENTQ